MPNEQVVTMYLTNKNCAYFVQATSYLLAALFIGELILFYTLQSLQQGPVAHSASVVNLQVIGSQQGSSSWHSSIVPQSHCSPSSITLFPHLLISNCISKADLVTITRDYTNLMRFYAHRALDSFKLLTVEAAIISLKIQRTFLIFTSFGLLKRQKPWPDFKASI